MVPHDSDEHFDSLPYLKDDPGVKMPLHLIKTTQTASALMQQQQQQQQFCYLNQGFPS